MPSRFRCLLALLAGASAALAGTSARAAGADDYTLDPVHTRVVFLVEHAGFSRAMGTISGSSGTLRFDRDDWRTAQLDVTVPLARLDLGDAKWNAAVLAARLLHAEKHPEARFVSRQVEGVDADHAKACGDLTLRGVTAPLCLDVTFNALKRHPLPPFRRTAGFSATATLSRKAFGIDAWPTVIGDEVKLLIEVEAVRSRGNGDNPQAPADAEPADTGEEGLKPDEAGKIEDGEGEPDPALPASEVP
ncbi:YceI family protein [Lysobacter niabensis]|uniref:YceI family protein n=1 Tax=Agrilutibacter niabensis TaxID=380628 RepID=UPI0036215473